MITGSQIRMARGHLKWSARTLARNAGVGMSTVRRMEDTDGVPSSSGKNLDAVQKSLEIAGMIFLEPDGLGPGVSVRLQKKRAVSYDMPALREGMWVRVGSVDGIICQIYDDKIKRAAEIVYDENGMRFVRNDIRWFGGRWLFTTDRPSGGYAEYDPLLARYIAELREKRG